MKRGLTACAMAVAIVLAGAAPAHAGLVGLARGSGEFVGSRSDYTGLFEDPVSGRISFVATMDGAGALPGPNGLIQPNGTIRLHVGDQTYFGWVTGGGIGPEADGYGASFYAKMDPQDVGYGPALMFVRVEDALVADAFRVTLPDGTLIRGTITSGDIVVRHAF